MNGTLAQKMKAWRGFPYRITREYDNGDFVEQAGDFFFTGTEQEFLEYLKFVNERKGKGAAVRLPL